ncbi:MAG: extracellular solute-binding protein [Minisyncoccia bacterium]
MALTHQQKKIISLVAGILIFIVLVAFFRKRPPKYVSLEMWGIYDEPEIWDQIIYQFNKYYPHIQINYTLKDNQSYHNDLLQAFAENKSPDIFMVLGEWLPKYQNKINPLNLKTEKQLNLKYLQDNYPEIVVNELIKNNQLRGIPLSVDTLALYYNKDIFNYFNIALPPKTWEEIIELIPTLRQIDVNGNLNRGAIALGTSNNVNWASDIFATLIMQNDGSIIDPNYLFFDLNKNNSGVKALQFYTQFADFKNKNYTWNENKINSILSFARAKTAMVIGYERAYNYIKQQNPQLNFGITTFPQFKNNPLNISYASTINLIVNNRSRSDKKQAAWLFLKFLLNPQISEKYYLLSGHPPARRDLIAKYLNDPVRGVFISQILSSRSFYQFDFEKIKDIFGEMISLVNKKKANYWDAVDSAEQKLNFLWKQSLKQ